MKKSILCVGILGLSLAVLGACSSNDGGNKTAEESTTTISSSTTTEIQASAQQTSERDVIEMSFNRIRQKSPILYRWVMNAVRYEGYRW